MEKQLTEGLDLLELGCQGNVELVTKATNYSSPLPPKTVSLNFQNSSVLDFRECNGTGFLGSKIMKDVAV